MEDKKSNIIDYFSVVVKWRKIIFVNFIVVCIITAIISLILPKTFSANSTILPPTNEANAFGLSSLIGNLPLGPLGFGGVSEETYTFMAILHSRTVMEAIAEKFHLMNRYDYENMEYTVEELRQNVIIEINEDGTITLSSMASTKFLPDDEEENEARTLARDMANAFIEELDRVNTRLKTEKAHNNRVFIEKRYEQNINDLKNAEEELKAFQKTYGVIALPEQTVITIETAAEINANIIAKEVEVSVLSGYVSESHSELTRAKSELTELRRKFDEMKTGRNRDILNNNGTQNTRLFIPLNEVPDLGLKYIRRYREVSLQQKILEFLLPQYEQAKIQEAKDTPTVQVLDKAVTPVKRKKPKRTIMVLLAGLLSTVFSVTGVFFVEYIRHLEANQQEDYRKVENILQSLKTDVRKLLRRK
ncbi:hypothetical protein IH970_11130 [candidate division KSB1 bacterium]|nr:hypothetical protein [candidate division KSB1 bacterium]